MKCEGLGKKTNVFCFFFWSVFFFLVSFFGGIGFKDLAKTLRAPAFAGLMLIA